MLEPLLCGAIFELPLLLYRFLLGGNTCPKCAGLLKFHSRKAARHYLLCATCGRVWQKHKLGQYTECSDPISLLR